MNENKIPNNDIRLPKSVTKRSQLNIYVSELNQEFLRELKALDPYQSWSKLIFEAVRFYLQSKKEVEK